MNITVSKVLLGAAGITGVSSAVAVPLSMKSTTESIEMSGLPTQRENVQGLTLQPMRINAAPYQSKDLTFDDLWNDIEKEFKNKQADVAVSYSGLSWKEDLKKIVDPEGSGDRRWQMGHQSWRNCRDVAGKEEIFCGYINFRENQTEYKLKITYGQNKWQVIVVKRYGSEISYYNKSAIKWIPKSQIVVFSELTNWENSLKDWMWKEMSEVAIFKEAR